MSGWLEGLVTHNGALTFTLGPTGHNLSVINTMTEQNNWQVVVDESKHNFMNENHLDVYILLKRCPLGSR